MPADDFLEFDDIHAVRLVLARRIRDALLDGMRADGATPYEVEEATGLLTSVAGGIVDRLGLVVAAGSTLRVRA